MNKVTAQDLVKQCRQNFDWSRHFEEINKNIKDLAIKGYTNYEHTFTHDAFGNNLKKKTVEYYRDGGFVIFNRPLSVVICWEEYNKWKKYM